MDFKVFKKWKGNFILLLVVGQLQITYLIGMTFRINIKCVMQHIGPYGYLLEEYHFLPFVSANERIC